MKRLSLALGLSLGTVAFAVDLSLLDRKADPCVDFYQYACGTWMKRTPLPKDRAHFSRGFTEVELRNEKLLLKMLEDYGKGATRPENPYGKALGDFYAACMDEKSAQKNGVADFRAFLEPVRALADLKALPPLLANLHLAGVGALFDLSPAEDFKNPSERILAADQGGMGLPSPEYYRSEAPPMKALRKAYLRFAESGLRKAGYSSKEAKKRAAAVLDLETKLAAVSLLPAERRDYGKLDHRLEKAGLKRLTPEFDWEAYFRVLKPGNDEKISIYVPDFFRSLGPTLRATPLEDLKAYLVVHAFSAFSEAMDQQSVAEEFRFQSKMLGTDQIAPRSRRCLGEVSQAMPFALGRSYVAVAFGEEGKKAALAMTDALQKQMRIALESVSWMDDATRSQALKKLDRQTVFMGYPDKWRSYDGLVVGRQSMLKNRLAATQFDRRYELDKVGKPVDRSEWHIAPMTVNAVNMINQNYITFPAAILQPPNFDRNGPTVENFGAMGTIVGHEVTHGYDDQGRTFDERGALRNWWSEKTSAEFDRRAACIVKQFDGYVIEKGLHGNGKLVQGEAIADLGGMKLAWDAWKRMPKDDSGYRKAEVPGMSEDKVFFLALAQAWCSKSTKAFDRFLTNTNPHPLDRNRINGTVRNLPAFAETFGCKAGAPLAPKDRCEVW